VSLEAALCAGAGVGARLEHEADAGVLDMATREEMARRGGTMEAATHMRIARMRSSWGSTPIPRTALAGDRAPLMNRFRRVWVVKRVTNRRKIRELREVGWRKWGMAGCSLETMVLHSCGWVI